MIKRVGFGWRRDGMSSAEFEEHYRSVHAPIAARIPGLRGYTLNFVDDWAGDPPGGWDAFAELWFDDVESMEAGFAALADEISADLGNFAGEIRAGLVREVVVVEKNRSES